LKELKQWKR